MISKKGKGRLRAANPENSKEPPMSILGTCLISVVFPPVDKIFAVKVRVVDQLPLGLILGTAFMRRYESSLIFEGPGAGWFKPTPTSPRVPFLPWLERPRERDRKELAVEETAIEDGDQEEETVEEGDQEDVLAWVTTLADQEWIFSEDEDQSHSIPEVMAMEALELGATAWQDQGTQKWSMAVDRKVMIPGDVSVEIDAKVEGAIPHSKTLVVVFPIAPYDLEDPATLGVSRAVQWWIQGDSRG